MVAVGFAIAPSIAFSFAHCLFFFFFSFSVGLWCCELNHSRGTVVDRKESSSRLFSNETQNGVSKSGGGVVVTVSSCGSA